MKKILAFCLFLTSLQYLTAQISVVSEAYIDSLIKISYEDSLYFFEKIEYAKRGLKLAKEIQYLEGILKGGMSVGICHLNLGDYENAVDHFQLVQSKALSVDSINFLGRSNYFLGNVNNKLGRLANALEYFFEAEQQFIQNKNVRFQGIVKNGIGIIYLKLDSFELGNKYLLESLQIFEDNGLESLSGIPIANLGEHYFQKGSFELAQYYYQKALDIAVEYNNPQGKAIALANLGWTYREMDLFEQSLEYTREAVAIAEEQRFNKLIADFNKDFAETYKRMGLFERSLQYHEIYDTLIDKINSADVHARVEQLEAEFFAKEKIHIEKAQMQEFELLKERQKFNKILNIGFVILAILAAIFAWLFFSRLKAKRKLVEAELKNKTLESENLQKELTFKNQDLTNFALDISRKNDFAQKLHDRLEELMNSDSKTIKEKARKLYFMANNHLKINEEFQEFQMNIEKVNQDFFNKLLEQFPDLTNNEKQLCGLIRLNLSTKDIASIKNISPKSVEMGRYRLRKKLKLDPKVDIGSFLQNL